MQQAESKRADILRTDEGIKVHIGNLALEVIVEPKHFGPLNPYEDEDGSPGIILWENEFVAQKEGAVHVGKGEMIDYVELRERKAKNVIRAIKQGDFSLGEFDQRCEEDE